MPLSSRVVAMMSVIVVILLSTSFAVAEVAAEDPCREHTNCASCTTVETCSFCQAQANFVGGDYTSTVENAICVTKVDGGTQDGCETVKWGTMDAFDAVPAGDNEENALTVETVNIPTGAKCRDAEHTKPKIEFLASTKEDCNTQPGFGWCDFTATHTSTKEAFTGGICTLPSATFTDSCAIPEFLTTMVKFDTVATFTASTAGSAAVRVSGGVSSAISVSLAAGVLGVVFANI